MQIRRTEKDVIMSIRNQPRNAAVFGIDIGKTVFHVVEFDASQAPIQKAAFRRETLLRFVERVFPVLVEIKACPGSQWLARKLLAMGHTVGVAPAQFVKPFVKSSKNDIIDAKAIAEAVTRPTMRFAEVRESDEETVDQCIVSPCKEAGREAGYTCADWHRQHQSPLVWTGWVIHFLMLDP